MTAPGRIAIVLLAAMGLGPAFPVDAHDPGPADEVVVDKSDRELKLLRDGEVVASFPVALGFAPEGHKQQEGDGRTPEGRYVLDWRNPDSKFYRSIHISYPRPRDRERARERGVAPGGAIFIHGTPRLAALFRDDWTAGCIAVSNAAMDIIWNSVADGTPITIRP